jgi:hypothetical protein
MVVRRLDRHVLVLVLALIACLLLAGFGAYRLLGGPDPDDSLPGSTDSFGVTSSTVQRSDDGDVALVAMTKALRYSVVPRTAVPKAPPTRGPVKIAPSKSSTSHATSRKSSARPAWYKKISGVLPSAYKGPGYDPRFENYRRCVVKRESNGHYWSMNKQGYSGAYQFGLRWTKTIQHWTKEYVPIRWMSRYAQDKAFWLAFNHGKGAGHWAGGRWYCGF